MENNNTKSTARNISLFLTIISSLMWLIWLNSEFKIGELGLIETGNGILLVLISVLSIAFISNMYYETTEPSIGSKILAVLQIFMLLGISFLGPAAIERSPRLWWNLKYFGATLLAVKDQMFYPEFIWPHAWPGAFIYYAIIIPTNLWLNEALLLALFPYIIQFLFVLTVFLVINELTEKKTAFIALWVAILINWIDQNYWNSQSIGYILTNVGLFLIIRLVKRFRDKELLQISDLNTFDLFSIIAISVVIPSLLFTHLLSLIYLVSGVICGFLVLLPVIISNKRRLISFILFFVVAGLIVAASVFFFALSVPWLYNRLVNFAINPFLVLESGLLNRIEELEPATILRTLYSAFIVFITGISMLVIPLNRLKIVEKTTTKDKMSFKSQLKSLIIGIPIFIANLVKILKFDQKEDTIAFKNRLKVLILDFDYIFSIILIGIMGVISITVVYGRESLIRFLLFASPLMAILIVKPFISKSKSQNKNRKMSLAILLLLVIICSCFHPLARFLDEKSRITPVDEVDTFFEILDIVEPPTIILTWFYEYYQWEPEVITYPLENIVWNSTTSKYVTPVDFQSRNQYVLLSSYEFEVGKVDSQIYNLHLGRLNASPYYVLVFSSEPFLLYRYINII